MKEKPYCIQFNQYLKLFEELTGCKIKYQQDITQKRLERFLKKYNIQPDNIFQAERLIKENADCFNSFINIFIPVESYFFRENDYLNQTIKIAAKHQLKKVLVAPCANGETVYSLKILCMENNFKNIHITGIDISNKAIEKAKKGIYGITSLKKISSHLLKKYFFQNSNYYKVKQSLKENIKFIVANLTNLAAFAKYDIILCCNFFIYLKEETIKKTMKNFYNILNPKGFLIVGKSELSLVKSEIFVREKFENLLYFRKTI